MKKLCVNCAHYDGSAGKDWARCQHPLATITDLVNGGKKQGFCAIIRVSPLACGIDANWYEPHPNVDS